MTALAQLRRSAVARSLFPPTTLPTAIDTPGLRPGGPDPRAGAGPGSDSAPPRRRLSGRRSRAALPRARGRRGLLRQLRLPGPARPGAHASTRRVRRMAVAGRPDRRAASWPTCASTGPIHPRDVDAHFAHGAVRNYWGGSSNATTHALDHLHYRGLLRVHARDGGIRVYAAHDHGPAVISAGRPPGPARRPDRRRRSTSTRRCRRRRFPGSSVACATPRRSGRGSSPARWRAPGRAWRTPRSTAASGTGRRGRRRGGEVPDAVRLLAPFDPVVLGSPPFRAAVGLGLSVRGLHARSQADARLLRAAAAVARSGDRLGQPAAMAGGDLAARVGYVAGRRAAGSRLRRRPRGRTRRDAHVPRRRPTASPTERR